MKNKTKEQPYPPLRNLQRAAKKLQTWIDVTRKEIEPKQRQILLAEEKLRQYNFAIGTIREATKMRDD